MALDPIQIQDAILARIAGSDTLGAYRRNNSIYQGGLSPDVLANVGNIYRYPATLLIYDSAVGSLQPSKITRVAERHNVLVADQSYRGIAAALRGDTQAGNIGAMQMLTDLRELLLGYKLLPEASSLAFEGETLLYAEASLVIYQASYSLYYYKQAVT